jgi:acyl-CoA reductase-like NAD-dependent aldehyde dehydrogenase
MAQGSRYGLDASIWTRDVARGIALAHKRARQVERLMGVLYGW